MLHQQPSALSFARQQKLDGEEFRAIAYLTTIAGDISGAEQHRRSYASSHPWLSPRVIEVIRIQDKIAAAVESGEGQGALDAASNLPDFQYLELLLNKARAHLLLKNYQEAEEECGRVTLVARGTLNGIRFPAFEILSCHYLGQVYEGAGQRDQARKEYERFISYFKDSHTHLAQVAEARSALTRLAH